MNGKQKSDTTIDQNSDSGGSEHFSECFQNTELEPLTDTSQFTSGGLTTKRGNKGKNGRTSQ